MPEFNPHGRALCPRASSQRSGIQTPSGFTPSPSPLSNPPFYPLPPPPTNLSTSVPCTLQGIMHRDIKPENLLLSEEYEVKLADFGLAINIDAQAPISRVGTLDYMAPEVGLPPHLCLSVPFIHLPCAHCTGVPPLNAQPISVA